jgi:hypothetical protein
LAWSCSCSGVGAAAGRCVAGRVAVRGGVCLGAGTLLCGSCVAPGGTAAGAGCELGSCADATPTAATIAHMELPKHNSFRTDPNLNMVRPPKKPGTWKPIRTDLLVR